MVAPIAPPTPEPMPLALKSGEAWFDGASLMPRGSIPEEMAEKECMMLFEVNRLGTRSRLAAITTAPPPPFQYPHNPAHQIGTCGTCGGEMRYNVPRLGPDGGFVHATGSIECAPPEPRGAGTAYDKAVEALACVLPKDVTHIAWIPNGERATPWAFRLDKMGYSHGIVDLGAWNLPEQPEDGGFRRIESGRVVKGGE